MPLRSKIEVERKFIPTALLSAQLDGKYGEYIRLRTGGQQHKRQGDATQSRLSFFRLPDKEIKDDYVDYQHRLSGNGAWIRQRKTRVLQTVDFPLVNDGRQTSEWQAKVRLAGDYTSSQMLEVSGVPNLKRVVDWYAPGVQLEHLDYTAQLTTRRKTWVVQRPFGWHSEAKQAGEIRIVLDEVVASQDDDADGIDGGRSAVGGTFSHAVGEIELTADVVGGESKEAHNTLRKHQAAEMQARLDAFVNINAPLFPSEGVKGKLQAWFEWKEERDDEECGAMI